MLHVAGVSRQCLFYGSIKSFPKEMQPMWMNKRDLSWSSWSSLLGLEGKCES